MRNFVKHLEGKLSTAMNHHFSYKIRLIKTNDKILKTTKVETS